MPGSQYDLFQQKISGTYHRVVQFDSGSGEFLDGRGDPIVGFQLSGSGNFVGDQTISGSVHVSESVETHYLDFTDGNNPSYREGRLFYNDSDDTLNLYTDSSNVTLQIGQEQHVKVRNVSGKTLVNGRAVYIVSASAGYPNVDYTDPISKDSAQIAGVTTEDITNGTLGYITLQGLVRDVNTAGFLQGDTVWVSGSQGEWTNNQPQAPYHSNQVGTVLYNHASSGVILANIQNIPNFTELHDICNCVTASYGGVPVYGVNGQWSGSAGFTKFVVRHDGVGIGTITPAASLDVHGDVRITGSLEISGSIIRKPKTITSNYQVLNTDSIIFANTVSAFSASLYDATGQNGNSLIFKVIGNGNFTIQPQAGQTIDEQSNLMIADKFVSIEIIASGSNWYII